MARRKARPVQKKKFVVGEVVSERKIAKIELGGAECQVQPMTLDSLRRVVSLAEPYFKQAITGVIAKTGMDGLADKAKVREALGSVVGIQIGNMVTSVPETFIMAVAYVMNVDGEQIEWFVDNVTPDEILGALEPLDELNDFEALFSKAYDLLEHFDGKYGIIKMLTGE